MKITKLNDDWLLVQAVKTTQAKQLVHIQVREPSSGAGLGRVLEEYDRERIILVEECSGDIAVMTQRQYDIMQSNYALGGCCVTWKGVMRYSEAHYNKLHDYWYGQPGQTARKLAQQGVPCPKEVHSLFKRIGDAV